MTYQNDLIENVESVLKQRIAAGSKEDILKAPEFKELTIALRELPNDQKAAFGKELNQLKRELVGLTSSAAGQAEALRPLDVTAPVDINASKPQLLVSSYGSRHPIMVERDRVLDIFYRMGFIASESREIDDEWHMFSSLNFPEGHPARDEYDTFVVSQTDDAGNRLVAPAHTSTMQNRVLQANRQNLNKGEPIAVVVPDRVFRNEDLDARHEHTFYQIEGVYVDKGVHAGMLIATLQTFLGEYYGKEIEVRTQPFYFPFTEPSFEIAISCPFCDKKGCTVCSRAGWIELLGCGMIHPNVLSMAGIDPKIYTGFAWGCGIDRLVMMKYGIEDIRHFHSGNLNFLRQFS